MYILMFILSPINPITFVVIPAPPSAKATAWRGREPESTSIVTPVDPVSRHGMTNGKWLVRDGILIRYENFLPVR
jgi:hypothetical protein